MQSKMFPELGKKIDMIYWESNGNFNDFVKELQRRFPNNTSKASRAIEVLDVYFKSIEGQLKIAKSKLNNILNSQNEYNYQQEQTEQETEIEQKFIITPDIPPLRQDGQNPEQQQVQSSDQTQQPQQQNPAVDPQPQPINPQLQAIMDQLKLLIDSNNNNIQCIRQLQGIVSAQSADIYNAMNNLGTLTNRVNLIAAGYIEPFAKDLPDDVATGNSN